MRRRSLVGLGLGLGVLCIAIVAVEFGARGRNPPLPAPAVPVTAAVAKRQDEPALQLALGTVTPIETVSVQARVTGQVMNVYFTQGQEVAAGAPLFLIDPRPYQAALDQAQGQLAHDQAALQEAKVDLARYQLLARQNSIAKQQADDQAFMVQQDEGTVKLDQANVATAALNVTYCHIDAPAAGMTGPLLVDPGNYVAAGGNTSLVTIIQIHPIYVSFSVPQDVLETVRENQAKGALEVDADTQQGKKIAAGKLSLIGNAVNTTTGTVMLEGTFDNADQKLWPDEAVSVRLVLFTRKNAVTVPQGAVMAGPEGSYVYVINADDTVKRVDVSVTATQDGISVIGKGLNGGEQVVTDGQYRLTDKVKVAVQANGTNGGTNGATGGGAG
ncbi:MAG TPA: efflux RND transporter periplasmic adaptor subunit [Stellaceae bacterium]|nr:efflux RND transporter periplasmic adaptor subunit [Stellaceae bacterium]